MATNIKTTTDFGELLKEIETLKVPKKGEIIEGTVVEIAPSAVLVDVGWKSEGVITGRELKSELIDVKKLSAGDPVLVYVVTPEDPDGMLVLSLRRTDKAKRWLDLKTARKDNSIIEVDVVEANNGGLICEIEGGIRGFIPTSQVDAGRIYADGKKLMGKDISQRVQGNLADLVGEKMKVRIIELDIEKNKIILSEKMVTQERDIKLRENTLRKMKIGDTLDAQVSGITPYGIFVNAQGVEGLVHLSELSWDKVEDTGKLFKVGDKIKVLVIDITEGGKRVAYSVKRLQKDPWSQAIAKYKVGDIVDGEVQKIVDYGFFVRIGEGLNGLVHISEVSYDLVKDINDFVKEGDKIKVKILSISSTERHLRLSLKRINEKPDQKEKDKLGELGLA
ncbi:S1 RNA-binding domain-containing protein [Candidatus Dojkabacteria bacterium]|nr:S1 RNA-binding domain-containing protein [Candidatus Dojkabacteria bacterium]